MAWPKKGTRKLVIDHQVWLYHYAAHCSLCSADCVTVGQPGRPHYLFLDTFSPDFEHTPGHVVASVRWALASGWSPASGPDRGMTATAAGFAWLPPGCRHATDVVLQKSADKPS